MTRRTGILLTAAFPKISLSFLAWIALVPLWIALASCGTRGRAALLAWITGFVFLFLSVSGLRYVTIFGWIFVCVFHGLIFSLFGFFSSDCRRMPMPVLRPLMGALGWTSMEFLRMHFPVFGFGWNLLAYSQASHVALIQIANLIGATGLGFLMAFFNLAVAESILSLPLFSSREFYRQIDAFRTAAVHALLALVLLGAAAAYGRHELRRPEPAAPVVRISVVQGNIPQSLKWETMARDKIMEIHVKLSRLAEFDRPDLVIWPEASFPGYLNRDPMAEAVFDLASSMNVPMIVGAPYFESLEAAYNSAFLIDGDGQIKSRYDKIKLVPFGEYLPMGPVLGWLQPLAHSLGVSDFYAGLDRTIFLLDGTRQHFAVLICFEDTFPLLAREFAEKDVNFFAVITNDAWFGPTGMPYQHLQASVFRAVENGIPVVRAANTGVSGFIDSSGRVLDRVSRDGKDTFVAGHKTLALALTKKNTFYRRIGWLFTTVVLGIFVMMIVLPSLYKRESPAARARAVGQKAFPLLLAAALGAACLQPGCLRLSASAWHKGAKDETASVHEVALDTTKIVNRDPYQPNITNE